MAKLYAMVIQYQFPLMKSDGSGDIEKIYVNVLRQPMTTEKYADFNEWKSKQDNEKEFIIELNEGQYNFYIVDDNMWIDPTIIGKSLPKWQYNIPLQQIGRFVDVTDENSTFYLDEPIPDTRFRLTLRHDSTLNEPNGSSPFLNEIKVDQNNKTVGGEDNKVTVRFEVRNINNVLVGNGRYEFYNAGTPTAIDLVNGVGQLFIDTTKAHKQKAFRSNHLYRVDNAKRKVDIVVFSKQIND